MEAVNWLLVNGANALLWLWELIKSFFGEVFAALDVILNPILSPVLAVLNPICTAIGDIIYAVFDLMPVWLGLVILSALAGILMLLAFRYFSNQAAIGRAKDDIKANLLALKLYKDELRVAFKAQARLLWAILRLQRYILTPVLIMTLPMLLALAQMGLRYQWRPLHPGERTLIRMAVADGTDVAGLAADVTLDQSEGVEIEVGSLPGGGEITWRVRGGAAGRHTLRFHVGGSVIDKELVVGTGLKRVSAARVGRIWTAQLFHPAERRLPEGTPIRSIEIQYAGVDSWIYGANWWVLSFFVVSMAAALLLKPLFKVRF